MYSTMYVVPIILYIVGLLISGALPFIYMVEGKRFKFVISLFYFLFCGYLGLMILLN